MWLPFVRSGNDNTPLRWWEWLLWPICAPVFMVGLFLAAGISIPVSFFSRRALRKREKELQATLKQAGRFLDWNQLESRWLSGNGTLIVYFHFPKGPDRVWWTPDDLIANAPLPLPKGTDQVTSDPPAALRDYALQCSRKYLDRDAGTGKLTDLSTELCEERKLNEMAAKGRLVTILVMAEDSHEICQGFPVSI